VELIVDARTVLLVSLCAFAVMTVFLAWSWRTQRLGDALGWWAAAFALATVDALLLFVAPDTLAPFDWIDEVAFLGATFALWFGFRSLNGQPVPRAAAAVAIALFVVAVVVTDAPPRTTHAASVALACVPVALLAYDTLRRSRTGASWRIAALSLLGLHGTILFVRAAIDDGDATNSVLLVETASEIFFVVEPMLMPMALGYVFLGLAFDRRHRDAVAETVRDPLTGLLNRRGLDRWLAGAGAPPLQW
jgi:hypothetical protein